MAERRQEVSEAVVFIHGIVGFGRLKVLWPGFQYFRGLRRKLAGAAAPIHFAEVPSGATVAARAEALARFIDAHPQQRIHLIAHSMGGLDSRYLIHHLDPGRRVRSLTTVGTPHRGTPLVKWVIGTRGIHQWLSRWMMLPGLMELSEEACEAFNQTIPDRADVVYRSYAGARPPHEIPPWFREQAILIQDSAGDNDSLVSVASATWGEFRGVLRADHFELAGWSLALPSRRRERPFDHVAFYQSLIDEIEP